MIAHDRPVKSDNHSPCQAIARMIFASLSLEYTRVRIRESTDLHRGKDFAVSPRGSLRGFIPHRWVLVFGDCSPWHGIDAGCRLLSLSASLLAPLSGRKRALSGRCWPSRRVLPATLLECSCGPRLYSLDRHHHIRCVRTFLSPGPS